MFVQSQEQLRTWRLPEYKKEEDYHQRNIMRVQKWGLGNDQKNKLDVIHCNIQFFWFFYSLISLFYHLIPIVSRTHFSVGLRREMYAIQIWPAISNLLNTQFESSLETTHKKNQIASH